MNKGSVFHLIYVSDATEAMTPEALEKLLGDARRFNSRNNITGLLLYLNQSFIQLLEGDKRTILKLSEKITSDKRNTNLQILFAGDSPQREFPNWSMGFENLTENLSRLPKFSSLNEQKFTTMQLEKQSSLAYAILASFRDTAES